MSFDILFLFLSLIFGLYVFLSLCLVVLLFFCLCMVNLRMYSRFETIARASFFSRAFAFISTSLFYFLFVFLLGLLLVFCMI